MFSDLINAAQNANSKVELQNIFLQISNVAVKYGLSFEQKMKVHSLVLRLSAKYDNFEKTSSTLMQIVMDCKTIPGKQEKYAI